MKYVETNNNIWNIAIMQKLQKHLHDHVMVVTQKGVLNSVDFTKTEMGWHRTNTVRHLLYAQACRGGEPLGCSSLGVRFDTP